MKPAFDWGFGVAFCVLVVAGCGGSQQDAKAPASDSAPSKQQEKPAKSDAEGEPAAAASAPSADDSASKPAASSGTEPTFPENATVEQATAAVPKGAARSNLDAERLAEPLQQESVYEPCKVGTQHFKVNVAVWAGQAVGVDVTTPNKKLAACIDKQIRELAWPDKVHSLNTVEFSF